MPILNSFKNSLQMPRTKSGFKNYQRIIALVLAIVFSAEQVSYAGRLDDAYSSIKSTLKSSVTSAKTSYNSGIQSIRSNYTTASNVYNAVKSVTGISINSIATNSLPSNNPLSAITIPATTYNYLVNPSTKGNLGTSYGAANTLQTDFALTIPKRVYDFTGWVDSVSGLNSNLGTKLYQNYGWARSISDAYSGAKGRTESSLKQTYGAGTYNNFIKPAENFVADTAIITLATLGAGSVAGLAGSTLGRLGSASGAISRLPQLGRIAELAGPKLGQGLSYAWQGTKGALTLPERLVTPYISSNAGRWLATYPIRYAEYELGLYAFRKSGLEDALIPTASAYRPAWDTTRDYILPFFIAPGQGGIVKETTKAFFTPGGVKTFAQTGIEYLGSLKSKATFGTLKSVAETLPTKLTRESIKSGIVNAGKTWVKEAKVGYAKLGNEGKVWVPVQMLRQGTHVAQDLAVFSAGTAVASGTLNKAGVKTINIPFITNINTLEFKDVPSALNTISEYAAGGAFSGLIFGTAMSAAGPIVGPVVSRTPVLGRFMRWYDDTYGNKLFETTGLEKRLAGNSFLSKQGISFINKFNRAQNFLAEEFWVFREPLAGAAFSSIPMPAGAREYLEESITDYGKRSTGSISFGLDTLHSIQAEGGVKEFIAKKIGGIADALGEIKLPNPLPPVAAAASITTVTPMPELGVPQAAAYSVPIIEPKTTAQPVTSNPNPANTFSSGWDSPVIQDNRPSATVNYFVGQQKIEPRVIIPKFQDTYEKQRELFLRFTNKYDIIGIAKLKTIDALTSTFNEGLKNQGLTQVPETWIKENLPAHYKVEQSAGKLFITSWFNHNVNGGGNYAEKDWLSGGKIEGLEDYLQHGLMSLNKYKQVSGKDISYAELKDSVRSSRVWLTAEVDTAIRYSHSNSNFIGEEPGLIFVFDKSIVKNFDQKVQVSNYAATIKDQAPWDKIKYILIPQKHYTKAIDILKATHPEWNRKAFAEKQLSDILVPVAGDNIEQYEINAKITLSKLYAPFPKPASESSPAISPPPTKLDSAYEIYAALGKVIELGQPRPLDKILSFIIERHSLHDRQGNLLPALEIHKFLNQDPFYQNLTEEERARFLRILDDLRILPLGGLPVGVKGILDRVLRRKPQAVIEISRPDTNIVKESPIAFEYISSSQKFQGVDLEHFVHAQRRLARKELSREELRGVLKKLSLKQELANEDKLDSAYAGIYQELARGNYNKDIIDAINGFDPLAGKSTYSDPRLNIAIIDQSGDARSQGVYEAVSNSLDALGFKIGQFGKGVKQIIDWLEPTGKDRIDVYSKKENEPAYQLTILKDTKGQNYLQIQRISDGEFRDTAKAMSSRAIDRGTIVKVTTQKDIPLEDSQHREQNSQSAIAAGIHKRFPFITNIPIIIQIGNQEPQTVNGFREKKVIVPARQKNYQPKEKDSLVHIRMDKHDIAIVDNGAGMDARVLSGMFVPEGGTKSPEFLSGRQIDEELGKVEVVHDKNLPHRVSFARNGEVIFTVDIPQGIHPDATLPGAGGLMLELGLLLDIQESRDRIVLKVGKENGFQKGVMYAINQILKHPELSAADKIRYINTIVIGLDGLIKGNENNAEVIKAIRQNILAELQAVIDQLRKDNFVVLPYQNEFGKFKVPQGKNVLFVHENLFHWGIDTLKELGAEIVPGIKLAGDKRLPLVVVSFKEGQLSAVNKFDKNWHILSADERVPVIKTDRFVAVPEEFGRRVLELSQKKIKGLTQGKEGLTETENLEFASLLELIKIITSDEVVTSYEVAAPKESLALEEIKFQEIKGTPDAPAINKFLTEMPETAIIKLAEAKKDKTAADPAVSEADETFKEALEMVKALPESDGSDKNQKIKSIILLAEAMADSGEVKEANRLIREAFALVAKSFPSEYNLSKESNFSDLVRVWAQVGLGEAALQDLVEKNMENRYFKVRAFSSIAKTLVKSDRLKAEEMAKKAFEIAKTLPAVSKGSTLSKIAALSDAIEALALVDSGVVNEAVLELMKEVKKMFIGNYEITLDVSNQFSYAISALARAHRPEEISEIIKKTNEIKRADVQAMVISDIAMGLAEGGWRDGAEAVALANKVLELFNVKLDIANVISIDVDSRKYFQHSLFNVAKVLAKSGNFDTALAMAEDVAGELQQAEIYAYMAIELTAAGKFDEAEKVIKMIPDGSGLTRVGRIEILSYKGKALAKLAQARGQASSAEAQPKKRPEELLEQAITQANAIDDPFHKSIALIPILKKLVETDNTQKARELVRNSFKDDEKDILGLKELYYREFLDHAIIDSFAEKNTNRLIKLVNEPIVPDDPAGHYIQLLQVVGVYALVEAGAIDEAIKLIDSIGESRKIDDKLSRAHARIAKALAEAGRTAEARKQLGMTSRSAEGYASILEELVEENKIDEAKELVKIIEQSSSEPNLAIIPLLKELVKSDQANEAFIIGKSILIEHDSKGDTYKKFIFTFLEALGKNDKMIVDSLINQFDSLTKDEKAEGSTFIISALADKLDNKIIDKLIAQALSSFRGEGEIYVRLESVEIAFKELIKAGKIEKAAELVSAFEKELKKTGKDRVPLLESYHLALERLCVSFVEALMSQTYKEITITASEGARTPPAPATAKQFTLFSDTRPTDALNEFEIMPHPNGKFYVRFYTRDIEPITEQRDGKPYRHYAARALDGGSTAEIELYTRIERVGAKGDTFIGYKEEGGFTVFTSKHTLLNEDHTQSIVDKKGNLIVVKSAKPGEEGYYVIDIFKETPPVFFPNNYSSRAKKITLSASGRFSIHEQGDGRLVYYDHTGENRPPHTILPRSGYKGYRVHEKADVVILQFGVGKYGLFGLKQHRWLVYESAAVEHIEIDSSGKIAIIKQGNKLKYEWLEENSFSGGPMTDRIRVSSDDRYIYVMRVDNDGHIMTLYFDKSSGDIKGNPSGRLDSLTNDKKAEIIPVRFWEEYDLEKKTIWDSMYHHNLSRPLKRYATSSPIDSKKSDFSLYDNVVVDINKENDGHLDLGNLDGVGLPDSVVSLYHTKAAMSLQGGKVWYILFAAGTCKVVTMDEEKINHLGVFSRIFVTRNNKFILGEGSNDGIRFLIDNRGNFKYIEDEIPEGFISTEANGDYFVFVNPDTRQIKYLDPRVAFEKMQQQEETPASFEEQIARQKVKEEAEKTIKHWQDSVLSKRDAFIAQARLSYQPFLELAPSEHKIEVEKEISKQIIRLYEEQDKAIRKRFAEAQDKSGDIDFTELPFEHFEKTMQRIKPALKEYIGSLNNRISQEPFDTQRDILVSLFTNLFEFSMHPELSLEAIDANLLEIISSGWNISTQEGLDIAPVIGGLIQGFKEINPAISVPRMRKIIQFLSDFLPGNPVNNKSIVEAQLKKILEAKEQIRKSYLEKMLVAFKDVGQKELDAYLKQPSASKVNQLGQAREFVVFLTHKVEHLEKRERFIPEGIEKIPAGKEVSITQIMQLEEKRRKSVENNEPIMPVEELISAIEQNNLPEPSKEQEAKILLDTKVQRESGAYTAEITQNSKDATKGKKGELLVSFYLQENEQGAQEYVEEAIDNGTGALSEIALLIPKSTKSAGGQIDLAGFFGTGKYTIFEGADRIEMISKNDRAAYMFSFLVNRDPSGNPVAIRLTNIRQVSDSKVAQGVTVRRIKATVNTIPELDQMLARRSWKTFAGLSQNENFNIYFMDKLGKKEPLEVKKEVLSQADFIVPKRGQEGQTNSGTFRLISCEDMPLQVIDRAGLRIGEIKEEYLELIPASLRKHIEELGIIIQIPLPLIRNRSDFELANYYLLYIQKYIAIEFYKVLAYKALTQTAPQFVFENLPFDWETNDDYWNSISLEDKAIVGLADKINKKDLSSISGAELKSLLPEEKGLDTEKKLLKLILLLKVETGKPQPESLLLRRLAVQEAAQSKANAEAQIKALEAAGMKVSSSEVPDRKDIPHLLEKVSQALSIKTGHEQMKHIEDYLVSPEDYTPQEKKLVELARSIAQPFGLEDVLLVEDNVSFAGGFIIKFGKRVMVLERSLANQMDMASGANVDEATNTIVHELAHLLEEFMRQGLTNRILDFAKVLKSGYITPNFTHDAVGTFAEAMKYVAGVTVFNHNRKPLP